MQTMYAGVADAAETLQLPPPDHWVMPNIRWGELDALFTPAFWKAQAWQASRLGRYRDLRLGRTLVEETAACLLGGFGMRAELGLAAYRRLRDAGMLRRTTPLSAIEACLSEPFELDGRPCRYRFPRQRARYLHGCLAALEDLPEPTDDVELRDLLAGLVGIGPKTASWIVRNTRASDRVAVLDVHIVRAGRMIGLFGERDTPDRSYRCMEARFLDFSAAIETPAPLLDAMMWQYMRALSRA